jgi:predicted TIM-barrel fold metal-dependent hydrolase
VTIKIDTHAHYLPPAYLTAGEAQFPDGPDGIPGFPDWSADLALAMMDKLEIETQVLSVSSPGIHFGDDAAARKLARTVNDAGAQAVRDHPDRFGLFASLPLPDVEGTLAEISYAFDGLNADGVIMLTNAQGVYLGDPRLDPVFEELNRRNAIIFIHPTSPYCPVCRGTGVDLPRPFLEFLFDSTRAITNLIMTGTMDRYTNLRIIVPHAGAMLPVVADRIVGLAPALMPGRSLPREKVFGNLKRLHYDLAGFPVPTLLEALKDIADPEHIFYGSDWPFTATPAVAALAAQIAETQSLDDAWREKIYRGNALKLFPRFARSAE